MALRPVVNGLERDYAGQVAVVRVKLQSPAGEAAADRWNLHLVPLVLALDAQGRETGRVSGAAATADALRDLIHAATGPG